MKKKISVILSFYNEEKNINFAVKKLTKVLNDLKNYNYEIIFVDDCSTDNSLSLLKINREKNPNIKIISLTRRFGHMPGIMAGLRRSSGDAVIYIDIDLQDPPDLIPKMVSEWEKGVDVVLTVRKSRKEENLLQRFTTFWGYIILDKLSNIKITRNSGDFRLISRRVADEYAQFSELNPFFRFLVDWIGYSQKKLYYSRQPRTYGKSNFKLGKILLQFFEISLSPFSDAPLRFSLLIGILTFIVYMLVLIYTIVGYLNGTNLPGWTGIMVTILFIGATQSLVLGMMAMYVAAISKEVKNRPLYITKMEYGFENNNNISKKNNNYDIGY